jgi:hypothetical protein
MLGSQTQLPTVTTVVQLMLQAGAGLLKFAHESASAAGTANAAMTAQTAVAFHTLLSMNPSLFELRSRLPNRRLVLHRVPINTLPTSGTRARAELEPPFSRPASTR